MAATLLWILLLTIAGAALGSASLLRASFHVVPTGHIGLVTKTRSLRPSRREPFEVRVYGGLGPQADVLPANTRRFLPRWQYAVEHYPLTTVPPGTFGVVCAHFGRPMPAERQLGVQVDCNDFADARAFLLGGGEMGRQPRVLPSGHYPINPQVFEVLTTETLAGHTRYDLTADDLREIVIPTGHVGVVTIHEGQQCNDSGTVRPAIPGHASFQYPDRFLAAQGAAGTQAEVLTSGGRYRINPWFAQILLMPTRELVLWWRRDSAKTSENYDASLDSISISVDGVGFRFDVSQTMRITEESAPQLVARLGDDNQDTYGYSAMTKPAPIKRFVTGVLGPIVEGNILTIAKEYTAVNFAISHAAVQAQLETLVRHDLKSWGIEAGQTTLSKFDVDDPRLMDRLRDAADAEQQVRVLEIQANLVLTEQRIAVVRQEIERGQLRLRSAELEDQIKLLGGDRVALERFLTQLAKMPVPQWVGSGASDVLNSLPLQQAMAMINNALAPGKQTLPLDAEAVERLEAGGDSPTAESGVPTEPSAAVGAEPDDVVGPTNADR